MSDTEDDLLFRIGFESHPQAGSKLEALAQAVEMTQKRIDQMFSTTADRVAKAVTTMQTVLGKTNGGSSDSGESKMRAELKQTADAFAQQTDRLVALQSDMVAKLDAIRQKDVSSADGHAKRLEAIYANTLANLNAAVAGAKAGTGRVQVAVGGGGDSGIGSMGSQALPQTGASQLEAMAAARRATQSRIVADAGEFNTQMEMAAGHEVLTLEQRNEAAQLFSRARAAILRGESEIARKQLEDDREQSQYAITQLRKDLELIEDIQRGGGGVSSGATNEDAAGAAERVKKYYDTIKAGQERQAAEDRKLAEQQIKDSKRVQDEQDRANRNRRRLIENTRKLEESEARKAEADAKKADAERDAAIRRRTKLIENSKKYERQLAAEVADEAIDAYEREGRAAARARQDIQRGRQAIFSSFEQTAEGIGKLSRAAVLLGLAQGEEMEKVIRQLAIVQAGVDLIGGTVKTIRGAAAAFEGLRLVIAGKIAAQRAATAADAMAVQGSVAVQNALNLEALSANRAAAAHVMLAQARAGGRPIAQPIVPGVAGGSQAGAGSVAGGSRGGLVAMGVGAIAGGFGGAMAGGAIGERLGGEQGQAIGTVIGTVAGGIIGPMLAAAIMRSQIAGRAGGALSGGVGGILGRAGGVAGGAVMGGAGSIASGLGIGVGGGAAMVAGTALAAIGGVALTLKSAVEVFKDARKNGIMGGADVGSFNDRVGGSNWNPASWLMAADLKFQNMADAEKTRRMENASVILGIEKQHLRDLQAIRVNFATQRESIQRQTADANFRDQLGLMRSPQEQLNSVTGRAGGMTAERDLAAQRYREAQEREAATRFEAERRVQRGGGSNEAISQAEAMIKAAQGATLESFNELEAAEERIISNEQERLQLSRQVAAENRKTTLDQIKGIEDVIRTRQKEIEEIEKSMLTAQARFGRMSEFEQQMARESFKRIKAVGVANANAEDIDAIRGIGTEETEQIVNQFDLAQGNKAGFNDFRGKSNQDIQAKTDEMKAKAMELENITGQDKNKILENARKPIRVDLVDNVQLEVVLNSNEDRVFQQIVDEIKRLRAERDQERLRRIAEKEGIQVANEQAGVAAAIRDASP